MKPRLKELDVCCACLSVGRRLSLFGNLEQVSAWMNLELHFQDYICWECRAQFEKVHLFRERVLSVQRWIKDELKNPAVQVQFSVYSNLTVTKHTDYDYEYTEHSDNDEYEVENTLLDLKSEPDPLETKEEEVNNGTSSLSEPTVPIPLDSGQRMSQNITIKLETIDDEISTQYNQPDMSEQNIEDADITSLHEEIEVKLETVDHRNKVHFGLTQIISMNSDEENQMDNTYDYDRGIELMTASNAELEMLHEVDRLRSEYVNAEFKCEKCILMFVNKLMLVEHEKQHTVDIGEFECAICERRFRFDFQLREHTPTHYKYYSCRECDAVGRRLNALRLHYKLTHCNGEYKCDECDKCLPNVECGGSANSTPSSGFQFNVQVSIDDNFSASNIANRKHHLRKEEKIELNPKRVRRSLSEERPQLAVTSSVAASSSDRSLSQLQRHRVTHEDAKKFECDICKKRLFSKRFLEKHKLWHISNEKFKCEICNREFKNKPCLRYHVRQYHSQPPQSTENGDNLPKIYCEKCDRTFKSKRYLANHMKYSKIHSTDSELLYECDDCNDRFSNKEKLRFHIETVHLMLEIYLCDVCNKRFHADRTYKSHMRGHKKSRVTVKRHVCNVCGKAFAIKKCLSEHMNRHTGLRPYECNVCGATFAYSAALYTHNKLVHLKQKQKKS